MRTTLASPPSVIGAPVPRAEGPDKVTGRAIYTSDVALPGMLFAKILRSPYPHARMLGIDDSAAREMPGVRAVVTGQHVPGLFVGKVMRDMPVLCWDRVRFIGDRVAAVAAESEAAAEAAIAAIRVEYEELPAVFHPLEAMEPRAPLIHEDIAAYEGAPRDKLATDVHNGQTRLVYGKGDVERGFSSADRVFQHEFRVPSRHQGYIEPHVNLVSIDEDGRVQLWSSSKAPFRARTQLAKAVGLPEEEILVHVVNVGGDFGGKGDSVDAPIAYLLAKEAGRPVKLLTTYSEDLATSNPSHPTVIKIRSGVTHDGRLVARSVHTYHACGAYAALKPNAMLSVWHHVGGAYRVPHAEFEFLQVYTNTTPGGYFRAPGAHQHTFALESHTDLIAAELGMDPAEFRLLNMIEEGEEDGAGNHLRGIKARDVLRAAHDAVDWNGTRPGPNRGRGIGLFGRLIGGGPAGAVLTAEVDGSLTVLVPTFDQGVGTHTIVQQVAAADMGLPLDRVRVVVGDTDVAPYDDGPRASRVTYTEGQAVLKACADLRARLGEPAAQLLDCVERDVVYRDGVFSAEGREAALGKVAARADDGQGATVRVQLDSPLIEDVTYFCAQIAEVEVDPATGQVRVERMVTAHDVGTIINPITHQGQIDGGVATGIGLALMEELIMEGGRITNAHLGEYKLPTVCDMPPVETVLVHSGGGTGPFEAKAIGEMANNSPPAAVANAVADAVGARLFELPITAERVLNAIPRD
jgi:CO/xanthine dehydrogenase Mo-binding subunit